ncbi:hypothetical protein J32TS6_31060 [Virgibacillus pantothenticus]|uniref:Uncharacterized protein n=1 Tax=Virgibacillus pantothenticus TaxID=1473 RepID=A0A0L0QKW3_VIRPA|nr:MULTISPECIES: hypothetical protein [Virgibacillus]API91549.1 hypothetical protein BKP57_06680 [Virgibacillus sp. 6R]KNE19265.1 hypothetical protein AFK71_12150 [Virgibacillus pantothenticus]MBS7426934.1 hypothetical protein [Virgibacillus sp. 19R1-5]SIS96314.1 hypothetical protein SAMN05421787_10855 [Virgibacillus pantothenticus]GIP64551.1 hypothetical protein J32TS6_31060 [Virgibacillus pantothenticus]
MGRRVGAEPHELNVICYGKGLILTNDRASGFVGTIVRDKSSLFKSLLSIVDLVTIKHRQKIGKQGGKGGDFLGGFPKKYYPNLAWRLVTMLGGENVDHAIQNLKSYMSATLDLHRDLGQPEDVYRDEIKAYVCAINALELYYYEEKRTKLEFVLS